VEEPLTEESASGMPSSASPVASMPPSTTGGGEYYTVRGGDTAFAIGERCSVRWQEIAASNGLANPSRLSVGQRLRIPGGTSRCRLVAAAPARPAAAVRAAPAPASAPVPSGTTSGCNTGEPGPTLVDPGPGSQCTQTSGRGGCPFSWSWTRPLGTNEYYQLQFTIVGTDIVRGVEQPTRFTSTRLSGSPKWVFEEACPPDSKCSARWSVAVVMWDGADPSRIGCEVARSEWRDIDI